MAESAVKEYITGNPNDAFFFQAKKLYEETAPEKWEQIFAIARALRQTQLVKVINAYMGEAGYNLDWDKPQDQEVIKKGAIQYHQTKSEHHRYLAENEALKKKVTELEGEIITYQQSDISFKETLQNTYDDFKIKLLTENDKLKKRIEELEGKLTVEAGGKSQEIFSDIETKRTFSVEAPNDPDFSHFVVTVNKGGDFQ